MYEEIIGGIVFEMIATTTIIQDDEIRIPSAPESFVTHVDNQDILLGIVLTKVETLTQTTNYLAISLTPTTKIGIPELW